MTDQMNWKEVAMARLSEKLEVAPLRVNEDGTPAAATLATKSATMSGILAAMSGLSHEDMMKWLTDVVQMHGVDAAAHNAATLQMHPSAASPAVHEEAKAIFGEDLNEEQVTKVLTLVENLVNTRTALARVEIEEQFADLFAESIESEIAAIAEQVDQYVTYAAEQWIEKNEVAIDATLKIERADRIIEGLRALASEANVELDEESIDLNMQLSAEREALQAKLDEAIADAIALNERVEEMEATEIFSEVTESMALTQIEKFKTLIEDVEIGGDREELKKKLEIIRDAHFKEAKAPASTGINEQVDGDEPATAAATTTAPTMRSPYDRLADSISRAGASRYTGIKTS